MFCKTSFLSLTFLLILNSAIGQIADSSDNKGIVGVSFSAFGENTIIQSEDLVGAGGYYSRNHYSLGLFYLKPLNSWLQLEAGIEYSKQELTYSVISPSGPSEPDITYPVDFSVIDIPITLRVNFWKYVFVNGGLLLSFDTESPNDIDKQSGIGALLGFGLKYDTQSNIHIFLNPYIEAHALIPFQKEKYQERLIESGVRFGIGYSF